ncbi:unnamed protein product [Clonostachys rosea]|uniref:F-box domain-containing protein n=1 Tax=Bionectria ochroleuca TaxID=29856 RepID=A0ABY6TSQ6_BIOOC|nr:unnamed protein product [Clonostachys rosea]
MVCTRNMFKNLLEARVAWCRLPPEIRIMILQVVWLSTTSKSPSPTSQKLTLEDLKSEHGISSLATVCLEWKAFFEKCTFKQLVLDQSDLASFQVAVEKEPHRLGNIKYLLFGIKLPEYDCDKCRRREDRRTTESFTNIGC